MASWAFLLRCQAGSLTRARAETARGPGAPALPREVEGRPAPRACRAEPRAGRGGPLPPGKENQQPRAERSPAPRLLRAGRACPQRSARRAQRPQTLCAAPGGPAAPGRAQCRVARSSGPPQSRRLSACPQRGSPERRLVASHFVQEAGAARRGHCTPESDETRRVAQDRGSQSASSSHSPGCEELGPEKGF